MNNECNVRDNFCLGALSRYGSLHPADGGGFTFVPNKNYEYINVIHFENPDINKVMEYLREYVTIKEPRL